MFSVNFRIHLEITCLIHGGAGFSIRLSIAEGGNEVEEETKDKANSTFPVADDVVSGAGEPVVQKGTLYLVPTPLGRADDMSPHARAVLAEVDYIACEDTRLAARLLAKLQLPHKELVSYYAQNAAKRHPKILQDLKEQDKAVALITDAGTPCISDPGAFLVKLALAQEIRIVSLPGPTAVTTALAASGLDPSRYVFEGFLPRKGKARRDCWASLAIEMRTVVFYEAPHRLQATLVEMVQLGLGKRKLTLARELTKRYEEYLYLDVEGAARYYESAEPKGEFTLVLEGLAAYRERAGEAEATDEQTIDQLLRECLEAGDGVRQAAKKVAAVTGQDNRSLYKRALSLQKGEEDS